MQVRKTFFSPVRAPLSIISDSFIRRILRCTS